METWKRDSNQRFIFRKFNYQKPEFIKIQSFGLIANFDLLKKI